MNKWHYKLLLLAILSLPTCSSQSQVPFRYPLDHDLFSPEKVYQLEWPVTRVAVIGAGVGGLIAYRELAKDGFDVHIFERDNLPGGNWHYTEETPLDAPIPNANITIADYEPSLPPDGVTLPYVEVQTDRAQAAFDRRAHRAPKPVWYGLTSNTPAPIQQIREFHWPKGIEWELPNAKIGRYLRAFASWHGVNNNDNSPNISYNTRVELVEKRLDLTGKQIGWTLTTKEVVQIEDGFNRVTWNTQNFDGVVIATGRYNAPNIPNIQNLETWIEKFPGHVIHSRQYRHPQKFAGKSVVIVGAATSAVQIAREVNPYAAKVYQSVRVNQNPGLERPTIEDHIRRIPANVSLIPEIKRFQPPGSSVQKSGIELVNGTVLSDIDYVLFATGYRYTYPFLPEYHNPALGRDQEAPPEALKPIVTDGSHIRSLHLDVFYIDNPTLAFINANFGMQSFTYAEFTSLAISKVWSGHAYLPAREKLWQLYRERVEKIGYGKSFQFLGIEGTKHILRVFQGWLNAAAIKYGGRQIDGLSDETWQIGSIWTRAMFGDPSLRVNITVPGVESSLVNSVVASGKENDEAYIQDVVFADDW